MELQLIQNEQFKVRKTEYKGETWFVGRDVADILGYKNVKSLEGGMSGWPYATESDRK